MIKLDLKNMFSLKGKTGVITGAGGELCGTMAEALAALGARIALLDLDLEKAEAKTKLILSAGGTARAFRCDVLDEESLREVKDALEADWGVPDFLINGAGGNHPDGSTSRDFFGTEDLDDPEVKTFFDLSFEGFNKTFSLNFIGTFLPTKIFGRSMAERKSGNVVNISSMNAFTPLTRIPAYSGAKAAVSNFTRWLSVHFAKAGIRVNAIAPGFFMTEQLKFLHIDQETGELTPRAQKVIAHTPMGRYGDPEELLGAVVFLLSEASSFVTGTVIPIDGGFANYAI